MSYKARYGPAAGSGRGISTLADLPIKRTTVTGTTSASGNLNLNLPGDTTAILSVRRIGVSSGAFICTPFWYYATGNWYCHITNDAASPTVTVNTAVTVEVIYLLMS